MQSVPITTDVVSSNPAQVRWLSTGRWVCLGTLAFSTKKKKTWPPRYSWNIVESGVKHGWVPAVRLKYDQSWNIIIRHPRFFTIVYIYIYISYKTTFFQKNILKLSLGRYLWNVFQDTQNSLNWICLSDSNFCVHGLCFLVI